MPALKNTDQSVPAPKQDTADALDLTAPLHNVSSDVLVKAFESSRSPLILTDNLRTDNIIVYANQAFLDLTGYDMDEVIGRNCRFLQGDDTDLVTIATMRAAINAGRSVRLTVKNYRKDGSVFWNDLIMSPLIQDGKVTHFSGMQLDITDRIVAEAGLSAKTDQLERSNHELEQFTYATSHDLQEPLRMISSYLQLIQKRYGAGLDEDGKTFLGFASEGAERMQQLISDLLVLSRVSTTTDTFKVINLNEVVERSLFNLRLTIEESGADVRIETLPELKVDAVQMTQLFQNLVGNALKYHSGAAPVVSISAKRQGNEYIFSVADNGIGIDPAHFGRIFAVFQRLHTRTEYAGTGIGLAICARIIERHSGRIWVESKPGQGSVFKFSLPDGSIANQDKKHATHDEPRVGNVEPSSGDQVTKISGNKVVNTTGNSAHKKRGPHD